MRSRATTVIGSLVLAICLVSPIVDMFDYWDHSSQTGTDTESTFVIVGLCVGALYTFAHAVLKLNENSRSRRTTSLDGVLHISLRGSFSVIVNALVFASPPLTALRI
jgi:hypothetical protein